MSKTLNVYCPSKYEILNLDKIQIRFYHTKFAGSIFWTVKCSYIHIFFHFLDLMLVLIILLPWKEMLHKSAWNMKCARANIHFYLTVILKRLVLEQVFFSKVKENCRCSHGIYIPCFYFAYFCKYNIQYNAFCLWTLFWNFFIITLFSPE